MSKPSLVIAVAAIIEVVLDMFGMNLGWATIIISNIVLNQK